MAFIDLDEIACDSYRYVRGALLDSPGRWLILTILGIIPVVNFIVTGYHYRVLQGDPNPPELTDYGQLFVDGLKYFVASLLYIVLFGIIFGIIAFGSVLLAGGFGMAFENLSPGNPLGMITAFIGLGFFYLLVIVAMIAIYAILLMYFMAMVRVARSRRIGAAFDFSEIMAHIGRIGWLNYLGAFSILSLILTVLIYLIIGVGFLTLFVGFLLILPLLPAIGVFFARFTSRIYDSAQVPA